MIRGSDRMTRMQEQVEKMDIKGTKVRDVLKIIGRREPPTISHEANIHEVVRAMCAYQHSRVLYVVDKEDHLVGVISLETLIRHVFSHSHERHEHPRHLLGIITTESARDLMSRKPVHAREDEEVEAILERMIGKRAPEIAIVGEEGKVVADLTMLDLLKVCE